MRIEALVKEKKDRFNDFVYNHKNGCFLQLYEWGELKTKTNWKPLRYMVYEGDKLVGTIQILKKNISKLNKCIMYSPRGPVCDYDNLNLLNFILSEIQKIAKKHNAIMIKIDPEQDINNDKLHNNLIDNNLKYKTNEAKFQSIQPRIVYQLPLNKTLDELLLQMSSKTRYNINYAVKKGVTIHNDITEENLKEFYRLLKITSSRGNFVIRSYQYYVDLINTFVKSGYAKLFIAKYEGNVVSGALSFICGRKVFYCYGASDNKYRNKQPNALMQWEMIKWAKENDCLLYDFGGVIGYDDKNHPLYGIYRFKKGFGGEVIHLLGEYDIILSKVSYTLWDNVVPVALKIRKKISKLKNRKKS